MLNVAAWSQSNISGKLEYQKCSIDVRNSTLYGAHKTFTIKGFNFLLTMYEQEFKFILFQVKMRL